jgi:hypothetical protein
LGQGASLLRATARQQQYKLVAPIAEKPVGAADQALDALHQLAQHKVATVVAEGVVDALEIVDVEDTEREGGVAVLVGAILLKEALEGATVEGLGEGIVAHPRRLALI